MQAISRRRKIVFSAFHSNVRILDHHRTMPWPGHWEARFVQRIPRFYWPMCFSVRFVKRIQVCTKNSKILLGYVVLCDLLFSMYSGHGIDDFSFFFSPRIVLGLYC